VFLKRKHTRTIVFELRALPPNICKHLPWEGVQRTVQSTASQWGESDMILSLLAVSCHPLSPGQDFLITMQWWANRRRKTQQCCLCPVRTYNFVYISHTFFW